MHLLRAHARFALIALVVGALMSPARLDGQTGQPSANASASRAHADSVAVADALRAFLSAFEQLDWPPFRAAFSDSATIFHPAPEMAERVIGPLGVDSTFRAVFADIRARATGGAPYHRLVPTDVRIQPLAAGLVLVTFHLRSTERLARRTVIFHKESAGWRILHLHASNMSVKP